LLHKIDAESRIAYVKYIRPSISTGRRYISFNA